MKLKLMHGKTRMAFFIIVSISMAAVILSAICDDTYAQEKRDKVFMTNGRVQDTVVVSSEEWPNVKIDFYSGDDVLPDQVIRAQDILSITHFDQDLFAGADSIFKQMLYKEAIDEYEKAAKNPAFEKGKRDWGLQYAMFKKAECLRLSGNFKDAEKAYGALFKEYPKTFWLPYAKISLLCCQIASKSDKQAAGKLTKIIEGEPDDAADKFPERFRIEAAISQLQTLAFDKEKWFEVVKRAKGLLDGDIFEVENPEFAKRANDIRLIKAETLIRMKKFSDAARDLDALLEQDNDDDVLARAYLNRARSKYHAGNPDYNGAFWDGIRVYAQYKTASTDVVSRGLFYAVQSLKMDKKLKEKYSALLSKLEKILKNDYGHLLQKINNEESGVE